MRNKKCVLSLLFVLIGATASANPEYVLRRHSQLPSLPANLFYSEPAKDLLVKQLSDSEVADLRSRGWEIEHNIKFHILSFAGTSCTASIPANDWAASALHLQNAQTLPQSRGEGQTICIVDTGVNASLPTFTGADITGYNIMDKTLSAADDNGHGTFISSLIVGETNPFAVATKSKLLMVKALDKTGAGTLADVISGIEYCSTRAQIINLSLGSPDNSNMLHEAIQKATAMGVTVVAAAGNGGFVYPAKYSEVLAVGAVNSELKLADFSAHGKELAFLAPGVDVTGTSLDGKLAQMSGTSISAALVSGVVAIQKSRLSKGIVADDLGMPVDEQGRGLVNAYATALNH